MTHYSESPSGECRHSGFYVGECIKRGGCPQHSNLQLTHAVEPAPDDRCVDCGDRPATDSGLWWQLGDATIAPRVCGVCADERNQREPQEPMAMSIHTLPDIVQGTDEWHDQRRGIVTASVVGKLVTAKALTPASNPESRGLTALLAAERITGWTDPNYVSDDMLRGIEDEPRARDAYAARHAPVKEVGFMYRDDWGFKIGYSPDGLVGDDGLIEVKSRRAKKHLETIVAGHPPIENMAQMQCGLLVSDRKWIDYVSYCGGMPLYVHRVHPNPKWFVAIVAAVRMFEANVAEMIRLYQDGVAGLPLTERIVEQEITF